MSVGPNEEGSNNWVIDGSLSASGKPMLAGDPHRSITLPSLRYLVHLNAPGWNVIGSGEPASRTVAKAPEVPAGSVEAAGATAESTVAPAEMELSDAEAADTGSAKAVERVEETSLRACREMIAAQAGREDRAAVDSDDTVGPLEAEAQLRLGRCYRRLGDREKARLWLERAEKQPTTRERASAELRALAAEPK